MVIRSRPAPALAFAVVALGIVLGVAPSGVLEIVLLFLPTAALLVALLLGHHPGADLIDRLRGARPRRRRAPAAALLPREPAERPFASGGTLLARCLAGRAPPAARLVVRSS